MTLSTLLSLGKDELFAHLDKCAPVLDKYERAAVVQFLEEYTRKVVENTHIGTVVDLYEIRANLARPTSLREPQNIGELHQYNFSSSLIAQLSAEYGCDYQKLQEEIMKREHERAIGNLRPSS